MKKKVVIVLFILFSASTIASILTTYYALQLSNEETTTVTLCTYEQKGTYDHITNLKPNLIYNKTTLAPNEGILYSAIVDHIDLTFTYSFTSNPTPATATTQHQITIELESPGKWTKALTAAQKQDTVELTNTLNFTLQIDRNKIQPLVDLIDIETGVARSTTYNVNIKPTIYITAETSVGTINETFTPMLTIAFKTDPNAGSYIDITGLHHIKLGQIQDTQINYLPWVNNLQYASYLFLALSISATVFITFTYIKLKPTFPPKPRKTTEKAIQPYKGIIAQTTDPPPRTAQTKTINLTTLEDLAKIAETLVKPILHHQKGEEHTFYILDDNTTYQHTTTANK